MTHGPLPRPRTAAAEAAFAALCRSPAGALVGFDFDGTLAPIVDDPAAARPHPGAGAALRALARMVGTVAIITGRPPEFPARLLGLAGEPDDSASGIVVLGHYGAQRWPVGSPSSAELAVVAELRAELPLLLGKMVAEHPAIDGVAIEDKGRSVAVHTRRTANPAAAFEALRGPITELAARHGLRVELGRQVLELRQGDIDKGIALEALVHDRDARVVVFVGDDLGDLAAFDALDRLRRNGILAMAVCSASVEVPELTDRADLIVDGPGGVVAWIEELLAVMQSE